MARKEPGPKNGLIAPLSTAAKMAVLMPLILPFVIGYTVWCYRRGLPRVAGWLAGGAAAEGVRCSLEIGWLTWLIPGFLLDDPVFFFSWPSAVWIAAGAFLLHALVSAAPAPAGSAPVAAPGPLQALIGRYGIERVFRSFGQAVHHDDCGTLCQVDLNGETVRAVCVINSTPEPDGSRKWYFLRVPAGTRRAKEGVAWTFGMKEEEYRPGVET